MLIFSTKWNYNIKEAYIYSMKIGIISYFILLPVIMLITSCDTFKEGSRQDDAFKNKKSASSQHIKKKDCISCPAYN